MKFIDDSVAELLANGKMKQIIESYSVRFIRLFHKTTREFVCHVRFETQ
jgi:hypothetical protein